MCNYFPLKMHMLGPLAAKQDLVFCSNVNNRCFGVRLSYRYSTRDCFQCDVGYIRNCQQRHL